MTNINNYHKTPPRVKESGWGIEEKFDLLEKYNVGEKYKVLNSNTKKFYEGTVMDDGDGNSGKYLELPDGTKINLLSKTSFGGTPWEIFNQPKGGRRRRKSRSSRRKRRSMRSKRTRRHRRSRR
jgi:hypothetical protein